MDITWCQHSLVHSIFLILLNILDPLVALANVTHVIISVPSLYYPAMLLVRAHVYLASFYRGADKSLA
jgi:hypothetical protein